MGNGASSKNQTRPIRMNVPLPADQGDTPWNRSNSDGCLLDTLSSSKTKVDLLEQQIDEYRDLLGVAEKNYNQALEEADKYKKQLAVTESSNLELLDRIDMMQDEMNDLLGQIETNSSVHLSRQLIEKEHEIDRLQAVVEKLTRDIKVVKLKCKEKLKTLKTSLAEYRQENSLKIYQLNEEIKTLQGENQSLLTDKQRRPSLSSKSGQPLKSDDEDDVDPRNHLIVELSSQVQLQETLIEDLREKLRIHPSQIKKREEVAKKTRWSASAGESEQTPWGAHDSLERSSSGYERVTLEREPIKFESSGNNGFQSDGPSHSLLPSPGGQLDRREESLSSVVTAKKMLRSSSARESELTIRTTERDSKRSSSGYGRVSLEKRPTHSEKSRTETTRDDGLPSTLQSPESRLEVTGERHSKSHANSGETLSTKASNQTARSRRKSAKNARTKLPRDADIDRTSGGSHDSFSVGAIDVSDATASNV